MTQYAQFSSIASLEKIDAASGIIYGVSVITIGEAQGKNAGTWIDQTTLQQIHRVASGFKDGVKVKMSMAKEHDGSVGQIVGVLKGFRTVGNHERADLHLLKSDENFAKIIEMSSTMPSEFGFSVVIPKNIEKVDGKECLRCDDIYSIDLVESPAANPSGLFTSKQNETPMTIKYAKGESGDHAKDCECRECMSKQSKKEMSAFIATLLGLSAEATETDIQAAFKALPSKPADLTELTGKITDATTKLAKLETAANAAIESAKKGEIAALVAEASRDGKVIPLTDVQLSKMEVADIREMITKLPKSVQLSRKTTVVAKNPKGEEITNRRSPEFMQFAREQRKQGAIELGNAILAQQTGLTRN